MTNDKPKRRKKPEKKRLDEQQLTTMGEIFPGFDVWYKKNYDADGKLLPSGRIPGLKPPKEGEDK